jgi:hypothetical protein
MPEGSGCREGCACGAGRGGGSTRGNGELLGKAAEERLGHGGKGVRGSGPGAEDVAIFYWEGRAGPPPQALWVYLPPSVWVPRSSRAAKMHLASLYTFPASGSASIAIINLVVPSLYQNPRSPWQPAGEPRPCTPGRQLLPAAAACSPQDPRMPPCLTLRRPLALLAAPLSQSTVS